MELVSFTLQDIEITYWIILILWKISSIFAVSVSSLFCFRVLFNITYIIHDQYFPQHLTFNGMKNKYRISWIVHSPYRTKAVPIIFQKNIFPSLNISKQKQNKNTSLSENKKQKFQFNQHSMTFRVTLLWFLLSLILPSSISAKFRSQFFM